MQVVPQTGRDGDRPIPTTRRGQPRESQAIGEADKEGVHTLGSGYGESMYSE